MRHIGQCLCSTPCLVAAIAAAGCLKEEPAPPTSQQLRESLLIDSQELAQLYATWATTHPGDHAMPLDFGNDIHYRTMQNRLRFAGKTPENSPELFARLADARQKAQRRPQLTERKPWCGQSLPFDHVVGGRYAAKSKFTCTGMSDMSFVDVFSYLTTVTGTRLEILASTTNEDYHLLPVLDTEQITGATRASPGHLLTMDSMTFAFGQEDFSGYEAVNAVDSPVDRAPSLALAHPIEIQGNEPDNSIRLCLYREHIIDGANQDCDYGTVRKEGDVYEPFPTTKKATGMAAAIPTSSTEPWTPNGLAYFSADGEIDPQNGRAVIAFIPLEGTYDAGAENNAQCDNSRTNAFAQLFLRETGGTCEGTVTGEITMPWTEHKATEPLWKYRGLVDFGPTCLTQLQDVDLTIKIMNDGSSCGKGRGIVREIKQIDFRDSCIAEGEPIVLASGKSIAVEKLAIGDRVIANASGRALTVQAVSHGFEPLPMVQLADDHGNRVRVTEKHPMVLASGKVVTADSLGVGDRVLTRQGASQLIATDRVKHSGKVFSFVLGSTDELAALAPDERTAIAGGFLVGDSVMQHRLEDRLKEERRRVASQVPDAWLRDYQNAVARKTVTERRPVSPR